MKTARACRGRQCREEGVGRHGQEQGVSAASRQTNANATINKNSPACGFVFLQGSYFGISHTLVNGLATAGKSGCCLHQGVHIIKVPSQRICMQGTTLKTNNRVDFYDYDNFYLNVV